MKSIAVVTVFLSVLFAGASYARQQPSSASFEGNGFVVLASPEGKATRLYVGAHDTIFCIDVRTGDILWKHKTPYGTVDVGPILANDTLVYAGGGGFFTVYGVNSEKGQQEWEKEHRASLLASGNHEVFMNTQNGIGVSAIDARTGHEKWAYDEAFPGSQDRLMYYEGAIYTADYVLDASTGRVRSRFSSGVRAIARGDNKVFLLDEDDYLAAMPAGSKTPLWRESVGAGKEAAGIAYGGGTVFVALYSGYPYSAKTGIIRAYDEEKCTFGWDRRIAADKTALLPDPIAADDKHVYVLLPGTAEKETVLEAWSVTSGEKLWGYTNTSGLIGPIAIVSREIYANDDIGHIYVVDSDSGKLLRTLLYPSPPPAKY
jgi:outer membrane protein assembly factor BamB